MSVPLLQQSFAYARARAISPRERVRLLGAEREWVQRADCAGSTEECAAFALDAAQKYGVLKPIVEGLVGVGAVEAETAPGILDVGARLARQAARGAADVATRTGAGIERLATTAMQEGHRTSRLAIREGAQTIRTGPAGETAQRLIEEGGETARTGIEEGTETAEKITTAQLILGVSAIAGGVILLPKVLRALGMV